MMVQNNIEILIAWITVICCWGKERPSNLLGNVMLCYPRKKNTPWAQISADIGLFLTKRILIECKLVSNISNTYKVQLRQQLRQTVQPACFCLLHVNFAIVLWYMVFQIFIFLKFGFLLSKYPLTHAMQNTT